MSQRTSSLFSTPAGGVQGTNLLSTLNMQSAASGTPSTPPTPASIGLSPSPVLKTAAEVAEAVAPLVMTRLAMGQETRAALVTQLSFYFQKAGVNNDSALSILLDLSSWPVPSEVSTETNDLSLLTKPVTLMLLHVAGLAALVRANKHYLGPGVNYESLSAWAGALNHPGRYDARGPGSSGTSSDKKMPAFKVPPFKGDTIDGDKFIKQVQKTFKSSGVSQFLDDVEHCQSNLEWSFAFASRILEAISDSSVLEFLDAELEQEKVCATVWGKIQDHLSSSALSRARVRGHWRKLWRLRCDDVSGFLTFYSKVRSIHHKLVQADSKAIKDDDMIRSYFIEAISATELQEESKKFIKDDTRDAFQILEDVHKDYRALETRDHIRDDSTGKPRSILRRAATAKDAAEKPIPRKPPKFPPNTNNKIPVEYYVQIRDWYARAVVPHAKRTEEQTKWLESFKFKETPPNNFRPKPTAHKGGQRDWKRPSYRNASSSRRVRHDSRRSHRRSRSPSTDSDREYRRSRRSRSYRSRSPSRDRDRRSESRSRSPSPRSSRSDKDRARASRRGRVFRG